MAKLHYLRLLIRDSEDLVFEVREQEADRLQLRLGSASGRDSDRFFWFESVDGHSVVVNMDRVQGIRVLWDPAVAPSDSTRSKEVIRIKFIGRKPIKAYTEDPVDLYRMFMDLEGSYTPWPSFIDEDGELFILNAAELDWVIAPSHVIDEGMNSMREDE